jgi:hypothetical protein
LNVSRQFPDEWFEQGSGAVHPWKKHDDHIAIVRHSIATEYVTNMILARVGHSEAIEIGCLSALAACFSGPRIM